MAATRRQAREWAIQMLTAADLNPPDDVGQFSPKGEMKDFAEARVVGVLANQKEIDEILVPLLAKWDLYRLGTIERAVLRMGVWEMKWSDVPKPVVINEAIDLANWFSTPKSRTLINAVLDKYGKELK